MPIKKNFSFKIADKIKTFNKYLDNFSVKHFNHDITFGNNKISILNNNEELTSYYLKHNIPTICTNSEGRMLNEGVYLDKVLIEKHTDCAQLLPPLCQKFGYKNTLHIVEREQDCQHLYTFAFDLNETEFLQLVINNINHLHNFISYYKTTSKDIIGEAKKPKNHLLLPTSSNIVSNKKSIKNYCDFLEETDKKFVPIIHKDSGKPIKLSLQQYRCLSFVLRGCSAKEVAREMALSYRTVEHYIVAIRKLLSCDNTRELISRYACQVNL